MKWRTTPDPDLIESPPYFIRRWPDVGRYVLGRDLGKQIAECLGGFDTSAEAKAEAECISSEESQFELLP